MADPLKQIFAVPDPANLDLEGILRILGQELFHYALAVSGFEAGAQDALQDLLLAVLEKGVELRKVENPRAWLFSVLRRKALAYRRDPVRQFLLGEGPLERAFEADLDVRLRLQECFAAMDPVVREIVLLHHWEGLTYAETAAVLGVPLGTVQSWCHRGLLELRAQFQERESKVEEGAGSYERLGKPNTA